VGDVIRNRITHEEGKIVRIVDHADTPVRTPKKRVNRSAYVVSIQPDSIWEGREALWHVSVVESREITVEKTDTSSTLLRSESQE
jgi:hypothetical protein